MKTPHAILIGLSLIAAAIFARNVVPSAAASSSEVGRYAIANGGEQGAYWKMNTATGAVQRCMWQTGVCQ